MFENIRISLKGIVSHKMRSILTMLGVIIGITSIIVIVAIIQGATESLKNTPSKEVGDGPMNAKCRRCPKWVYC